MQRKAPLLTAGRSVVPACVERNGMEKEPEREPETQDMARQRSSANAAAGKAMAREREPQAET